MEIVEAARCYGVYKDYDGNAHDSQFMLYVETANLAQHAVHLLNEEDGGSVYCEGFEWSAAWDFRSALAEVKDILKTEEAVIAAVEALRGDLV